MLTAAEYEAKLDEFNALAGIVKTPPVPKLYIGVAKWKPDFMPDPRNRDNDGRSLDILELERQYQNKEIKPDVDYTKIGRSLIRSAYNIRATTFMSAAGSDAHPNWGDGYLNFKDYIGTVRSSIGTIHNLEAIEQPAYGNHIQKGIHIGTDNTAVAQNNYGCISHIDHGDAVGSMRYWDMFTVPHNYDVVAKTWTKEWIRYFTNHNGNSITVAEMALFGRLNCDFVTYYAAIARDLLSPAVDVAVLELIRCKYTISFDFSSID